MGSRRTRAATTRPHRVVIRHSEQEFIRVSGMALAQNISVPRLYERALLTGDAVAAAEMAAIHDELHGVRRLLANQANNVNQIAARANSTGEIADETTATLRALRRMIGRLDELVGRLPGATGTSEPLPTGKSNPRASQ